MKKITSIIGTRPQYVKCCIINSIQKEFEHLIIDTGQHYDEDMSLNFISEFNLENNISFATKDGRYTFQKAYEEVSKIILNDKPDKVLVYGDTYSTVIGSLVAIHNSIPLVHIEAGLRSNNFQMEELNRRMVDHVSDYLFAPTPSSVQNLQEEKIRGKVFFTGDLQKDMFVKSFDENIKVNDNNIFVTIHRSENTDCKQRLKNILTFINNLAKEFSIVFPIHPRTMKSINLFGYHDLLDRINFFEPTSYNETMKHIAESKFVITDSGGLQKETYFSKRLCLTLREVSEWTETKDDNFTCDTKNIDSIYQAFSEMRKSKFKGENLDSFGDGNSAQAIVKILEEI